MKPGKKLKKNDATSTFETCNKGYQTENTIQEKIVKLNLQ
jgi:hypothetical protein